jgi:hypothetical protein
MKSFFCFVLFLSVVYPAQSQIDVAWGGQQVANPKNSEITNIIGSDESRIYALKIKSGGWGSHDQYFLDSYARKSMTFAGTTEFSLPQQTERTDPIERFFRGKGRYETAELEKLIHLQNRFIVFSSYYNSDQDKNYAFVQTLTENGIPGKAYSAVDTIKSDGRHNKGYFGFVVSDSQTQILVYHIDPADRSNFANLSLKMFDENMNLRWAKVLELPYPDSQFHLTKIKADNQGNVFLLASIDKNKENTERHKPTYNYSMLAYFHELNQVKEYTIDLGDKYISDIAFNINPDGNVICAGFYSKSSETSQAGSFFLKIDKKTTEVSERNVSEFPKDFLLEFMTDRKKDKGRELYNFDIQHLLLRTDGTAVMVAEQYFMDVVSFYNPASHSYNYSYHYYYNDIIVLGFDPKGSLTLLKKISKYQHTVNDGGPYSSYVLVDGGDMLHFIYNDNPDNLHRTETEIAHGKIGSMNNPGRSVVVMVSMDNKGNTQRTQLLDNHSRKNYSWFTPKMYKKVSDKELILFAHKGRYYRFGRITL